MIYLGYNDKDKVTKITSYILKHDISKVYVLSNGQLHYPSAEHITYPEIIMYKVFYPLLQKLNDKSLIVIYECLRTQNRYDLTYNCIRHYLNKTKHQLIFQYIPIIDNQNDIMTLFDFDTQSRWKFRKFDNDLLMDNSTIDIKPVMLKLNKTHVPISETTIEKYKDKREKLFKGIGGGDPHTIPRNLHMVGVRDRDKFAKKLQGTPITRNNRFKSSVVYKKVGRIDGRVFLVDLPHRFIDFTDFLMSCGQEEFDVLVTDLKVDEWYFERYLEWGRRLNALYSSLQD